MENLYVIGGHGPVVTVDTAAFKYSPGTSFLNGPWQFAKRMMYARNNHGVVDLQGKIYAFGGKDSTNTNFFKTVEEYDPVNNSWSLKTDMTTACSNFGYAVLGGIIYVAGGSGNAGILKGLQTYNPNTNSWTGRADLPVNLSDPGLVAGPDGFLYAFGGVRQDSSLNIKIYKYSPGLNQWDSLSTAMPTPRFAFGCVSFRGKIYLVGGRRDTSMAVPPVNTIEIFDPGTQTWSYTDNLPQGVSNFAITVYGPGIVIAGGRDQAYAPRSRVDIIIPNPIFAEIGKKMRGKLNEIIHVPIYINGDLSADSVFSIELGVTYKNTWFDSNSVTIGPLGSQFGSNIEHKFKKGTTRDTLYLAMGGSSKATGAGKQLLADMNIKVIAGTNGTVDSMLICRSIFNEGRPMLFRMPGTVRIQPVYGDVDMADSYGTVSANDAAQVLQHRVKILSLNSVQQERADVSGRQSITAYDASLILQYTVGLITMFPPESTFTPAKIAPVGPQLVIRTDMERGVTEKEIADVMIAGK
ncbi:MAG: hypothetical protein M1426_04265, partial [Patescibacteria group bacterium]|nr:hypothetical protein [Patescibacteria group bacterium]